MVITGAYRELEVAFYYGYRYAIHVEELACLTNDQTPNDYPL